MATFKIVVVKADQKTDKTWQVKIRVTHKRQRGYIGTDKYVTKDKVNNNYDVIDNAILMAVEPTLSNYRKLEAELGGKLLNFSLKQFTDFLKRDTQQDIDFMKWIDIYLSQIEKPKTWATYNTTKNRLLLFTGLSILPITMVTATFLKNFEQWLRRHREDDHFVYCTDTTINLYMRNVRAMFNAAREKYNNEDIGDIQIKHYPFAKYTIPEADESVHRNIELADIRRIRDIKTYYSKTYKKDMKLRSLDILGQDVFFISLCLIGMSTVDIYNCPPVENGRITYIRTKVDKVKKKRKKKAVISINVEPDLLPYLEKYKGDKMHAFNFNEKYPNFSDFNKYVNRGLNRIGEELKLSLPTKLSSYYSRHSWSSIAANDCHIPLPIIQKALVHSQNEYKTTLIYVKEDWSDTDNANLQVLYKIKTEVKV